MAICPECGSIKPFFARRCHACNEEIGFWRQTIAMYVFYSTVFIGLWFVVASVASMSFQWGILWFYLMWVGIPLLIIWFLIFVWMLIFS